MGTFELVVIAFSFVPERCSKIQSHHYRIKNWRIGKITIYWAEVLSVGVIFLSALENFVLTKSFFPSLAGIDAHTSTMKMVGPMIRVLLPLSFIVSFIDFKDRRSPWCILLSLIEAIYLVLGIGSRYWFVASIITFLAFVVFFSKFEFRQIRFSSFLIVLSAIFLVGLVVVLNGERRIGSLSYSSLIQYNGPFAGTSVGECIAWFYGYFPYSFENLNTSVMNVFNGRLYTSGKLFLMPFAYVTELRYILPFSFDEIVLNGRLMPNGSGNVPTAFFYFFSDFGFLFFVFPIFYLSLFYFSRKTDSVLSYGFSAFLVAVFLYFSFDDMFQAGILLWFLLSLWVFQKFFIVQEPSLCVLTERATL